MNSTAENVRQQPESPRFSNSAAALPNGHAHGDGPTNPFDIAELREGGALEDYGAEEVMLSLDVRRPRPKEYFRVHPDPAYRLDAPLLMYEAAMDRVFYWVAPHMRAPLADYVVPYRLFTCSSKVSPTFLWAAKLPIAGNSGRKWAESGLRCAVAAMSSWGKLKSSPEGGGYIWMQAKASHPDPVWTDKPMEELIQLGFGENIINSPDHLVVKMLEGDVL
jgi:hypothetical protein